MDTEQPINASDKKTSDGKKPHHKAKKAEGKKPVAAKPTEEVEVKGRARARTQVANPFDNKKAPVSKKETKPIETIGNNRFKDLVSRFEKPKAEEKNTKEDPGPKKLDMSKFNAFAGGSSGTGETGGTIQKPVVANSIQQKIEEMMNSKKRANTQILIDPVLEQRKKLREECGNDNEEEDGSDDADLDVSDDKIEEKDEDWDAHSNSGDENPKEKTKDAPKEKPIEVLKDLHKEQSKETEIKEKENKEDDKTKVAKDEDDDDIDYEGDDSNEDKKVEKKHNIPNDDEDI